MKNKKPLIIIAVIIIVIVAIYLIFFRNNKIEYSLVKAGKGSVLQQVSETGTVKMGKEINLNFKNSGRIEEIYVKEGETVKAGQDLAKLDVSQLVIQLAEAKSSLELAEAKKTDAQISLESAERDLDNVKEKAEDDLNSAYEDALTVLDDAYLKIYNAFNAAEHIKRTYFTVPNEYGLKVGEEKNRIEIALETIEDLKNSAENDSSHDNIDSILPQAKEMLEKAGNAIKGIRDIADGTVYRDLVSSTDKASLDTQKLNINTVLTNLINAQQNISTVKISNTTNINNAEYQVETLKSQLKSGGESGLYQAQINQAQAQVALLEKQIQESTLQSPTEGKVIKVDKNEGETAQITETIISLLPAEPFQIEVDIYEEDIVKVEIGNPVDINITAFSEKIFPGRVISIDPAEKIIDGVVFYKVTIEFEEAPSNIKPGMTADIVVKTAQKDNVLTIPEDAITEKDGKTTVEVMRGDKFEVKEIEIGLKGSNDMVEVVSGLVEGEDVVIR